MAAIISILGVVGTQMWSKSNQVRIAPVDAKPVAEIKLILNEVQRRPANRLIWQHVYPGQELYAGEAVRTAGDAEVEIEFREQKVTVRLDPYSVIEIQEGSDGLNLDFLKGNVFIASATDAPNITMSSGDQKLAIGQSEFQMSKQKATDEVSVNVFKGKPKVVSQNGQTSALPDLKKLRILSPRPGDVAYVKPESEETVVFEWEAIDSAYQVYLEVGKTTENLKEVSLATAAGSAGRVNAKLNIGKGYYRLVARSSRGELKELKSSPTRYEVRAKVPPVLLAPAINAMVQPDQSESLSFQWSNPGDLEQMLIEVSSTKDMKQRIHSEEVGRNVVIKVPAFSNSGPLFWRVSGQIPGAKTVVSSAIQQFFLRNRGKNPMLPPVLKAPVSQYTVNFEEMRNQGVTLNWIPIAEAKLYTFSLLKLGGEKVAQQDQETKVPDLTIRDLKPGIYQWFVTATDEFGEATAPSEKWTFSIEGVPTLTWSDGLTNAKTTYKALKPLARLSWQRGPANAKSWRVRMSSTREPASDGGGWYNVNAPQFEARPETDGTYYFEAEALDENGVVVGKTALRSQEFVQSAAPVAPEFTDETPDQIEARDDGSLDIAWKPVAEAREYTVLLKAEDGTTVKTAKTTSTRGSFSKLKPGRFSISLQATDSIGRSSAESPARPLSVPEYSDVQAPTLRSINVK